MATAPPAAINAFGRMVDAQSAAIRNIANEPAIKPWLEALAQEKLGAEDARDERQKLCACWLATVGRKAIIKEGAAEAYAPGSLDPEPAWIGPALAAGKPVQTLSLDESERDALASAIDWMRGPQGPNIGAHWSKISLPQAVEHEKAWIDELAKQAALNEDSKLVKEGTHAIEALSELSALPKLGPSWAGWSWVDLRGEQALAYEGGAMRHCVGGYFAQVKSGDTQIYSLRDPAGKPKATLETHGIDFVQLKAKSNARADKRLSDAATALIRWKLDQPKPNGRTPTFRADFKLCGIKHNSIIGVFDQDEGVTDQQRAAAALWSSRRNPEAHAWPAALADAIETHAWPVVDALLPLEGSAPSWFHAKFEGLRKALTTGDEEMSNRLLDRITIGTADITALIDAIDGGSPALVARVGSQVQPGFANHAALAAAAKTGKPEIFEAIMKLELGTADTPFDWEGNGAARIPLPTPLNKVEAAIGQGGSIQIARSYLSHVPAASRSWMLEAAAAADRAPMVRWLFEQGVDPVILPTAFLASIRSEGSKAFEVLLPLCDPLANDSLPMITAARHGNLAALDRLLPLSDPNQGSRGVLALMAAAGMGERNPGDRPHGYDGDCVASVVHALDPCLVTAPLFIRMAKSSFFQRKPGQTEFIPCPNQDAQEAAASQRRFDAATKLLDGADPVGCLAEAFMDAALRGEEPLVELLWTKACEGAARQGRSAQIEALHAKAIKNTGIGGCESLFERLGGTVDDLADAGLGYVDAAITGSWTLAEKLVELAIANPRIRIDRDALALAAEFSPISLVEKLMAVCDPMDMGGKALIQATRGGRIEAVELLLPFSDPSMQGSESLRVASAAGRMDLVELLLPGSDPAHQDSAAIRDAAKFGHWEIAEKLWALSDPDADGCQAMRLAILAGRAGFIAAHLDDCDPMAGESALLRACAKAGDVELAARLLPLSDPRDAHSEALRTAVARKDYAMAALLAPHSDVDSKNSEALKRAVKDAELEVLQAIIPHADPEKSAKIIKAAGFEDEAEAMLLSWLDHGCNPGKAPPISAAAPVAPSPPAPRGRRGML